MGAEHPDNNDSFRDLRTHLRRAQQDGDTSTLAQTLRAYPEIEDSDDPNILVILSLVFRFLERPAAAQYLFDRVDPQHINDAAALADLGLARLMSDDVEGARTALEAACARPDAGYEAYMRLGALELAEDQLSAAAHAFEAARVRNPEKAEVLSNLGGARFRQGAYQEALERYDEALLLNPNLLQARQMRGRTLLALDRADELVEEAREIFEAKPDEPEAHLYLASVQIQAEQWAQADTTLSSAVETFPESDDVKRAWAGFMSNKRATYRLGVTLKAWASERSEPDWTSLALNRARIDAGYLDTAETALNELAQTDLADDPAYPVLRARLLIDRARAEEAIAVLSEALARHPGNTEARSLTAHTLTSLGRLDEAADYHDRMAATHPMAVVQQVEGRDGVADDVEIGQGGKLFRAPLLEPYARARGGFTLATAHDRRGEYDQAFPVLNEANALARRRLRYDWRRHRALTQRQIDVITPEVVERLSGLGCDWSRRPIFVIGMPRSGTTLTEQILCSHPDVYGAGELNWMPRLRALMPKVVEGGLPYPRAMEALSERNLKSAAKYYLDRLATQEDRSPRTVDKLPHNFDNVALIALAFPHAPIVHLDREPRDVGVSNYFQNFVAAQGLMGFAYDLSDIGHMLNDHDRIMRHWHALFPGRIFELGYERLVSDPEATIRELLAFCGLDWDDRVMRFYETQRPVRTASIRQVRQGIYGSSAEKWRRYADFLDPLETVLSEGYRPLSPRRS